MELFSGCSGPESIETCTPDGWILHVATPLTFGVSPQPKFGPDALPPIAGVSMDPNGFVATLFGDDLPRRVGRLTLNPLKHLDPLGTLMILIGPIGWGRPMPINPGNMRNPNLGWALSSLAGPVSNVLAASLMVLIASYTTLGLDPSVFPYVQAFINVNVLLAVFNLLPVPPLDGFGFLFGLSPRAVKLALLPVQRYGPLILLAVLFLPGARPFVDAYLNGGREIVNNFLGMLASGA